LKYLLQIIDKSENFKLIECIKISIIDSIGNIVDILGTEIVEN